MLVFDLETDGLLDAVTKIHCLVIKNTETGDVWRYRGDQIEGGVRGLMWYAGHRGIPICGHNVIRYDLPVLRKLFPWFSVHRSMVIDTIVLAGLLYPDDILYPIDSANRDKWGLPRHLTGAQSLEAWGYRVGLYKGDYSKSMRERGLNPWAEWNQEMEDYCVNDVEVTCKVLEKCLSKDPDPVAVCIEHRVAEVCFRQELRGVMLDVPAATAFYQSLVKTRLNIARELKTTFTPRYLFAGKLTPKVDNYRMGYVAGAPLTKVKLTEFNPSSRDHIATWLKRQYGWVPKKFTDGGKPAVDESVLKDLPYPGASQLYEYLMTEKRIGMLAEGDQAWLKKAKKGVLHGRVKTNKAVTGRAAHASPNMAQAPRVGKPYGKEFRSLIRCRPGHKLVGADQAGVELRALAHYMAPFDAGAYGKVVCEGKQSEGTDIHTVNQKAAGLPTRDNAKTFIYAFLYGAGDEKIGAIVGKGRGAGRELKARFLAGLPALNLLISKVQRLAKRDKYLPGLDGRQLKVRSAHAALNTLLQSAGAVLAKLAIVLFDEEIERNGWRETVHQVLWVHDELQVECEEGLEDAVGQAMVRAFEQAGDELGVRVPITGEYKIGDTWADTH